jgi:hypothetical protein
MYIIVRKQINDNCAIEATCRMLLLACEVMLFAQVNGQVLVVLGIHTGLDTIGRKRGVWEGLRR